MGKLTALAIIVFTVVWLGPMCAELPKDQGTIASEPPAAVQPLPAPETPKPVQAPSAPAPAVKPDEGEPMVTVKTYRMKKPFEAANGRYYVHVIRENKASVPAVDVRMSLVARAGGKDVETSDAPAATLAPMTTAYAGLTASVAVIDGFLDAPDLPGNELEWSLAYRLQGDPPASVRCYVLRALPRRRDPVGVTWRVLGSSADCK